jgi:2-dehydropantoate 2-reductase
MKLSPPLRLGVVGAGAIGTLFAASLAPHAQIVVLVRNEATRLAIERRSDLAPDPETLELHGASSEARDFAGVDAVFVAVKTGATVEALAPLRDVIGAGTPVVSLQNGILQVAQIEAALGPRPIVLAPTTEGGILVAPGAMRRVGRGMTTLGWARARSGGNLRPLRDLLIAASLAARIVDPIEPHVWAKLIANAAINPLTASAGVSNGAVATDPLLRERAAAIAREAAALAAAEGVALPFEDPVAHVYAVAAATAENRSSMLQDLERGRPTELEAINGELSRLGRLHRIPTPENDRAADEVRARANA